jgi:hypothetical protein
VLKRTRGIGNRSAVGDDVDKIVIELSYWVGQLPTHLEFNKAVPFKSQSIRKVVSTDIVLVCFRLPARTALDV